MPSPRDSRRSSPARSPRSSERGRPGTAPSTWATSGERAADCSSPTARGSRRPARSEEHTSELQSQSNLVCRLLLEKKKKKKNKHKNKNKNRIIWKRKKKYEKVIVYIYIC